MSHEQSATVAKARDVVVRSHVVHLEAIESALRAQNGVRAAVAEVEQDDPAGALVAVYVVMDDDGAPCARVLRSALLDALPSHAIPLRIVALATLPLTADGTIDRAALATAYGEVFDFTSAYVAPRTAEEQALAEIWCAVLGMDRIGIDDDFFGLGGQSLHAIQIVARIADDLASDVSVDQLFDRRTIRALAGTAPHA